MKRTIRSLRAFGLKPYLSKKFFSLWPSLYIRTLGRTSDGFVMTAYGVEMAENWTDGTFCLCVFGGHGRVLADLLTDRPTPFVFLDIGANQGLFSLVAARLPHAQAIIAFEPVPETFEILEQNMRRAGADSRVQCVASAVAAETGEARIALRHAHSSGASMARDHDGQSVTIPTISAPDIDRLIPAGLDLVVKIDVEGFEEVVVREILKLEAADRITHLFFEVDLNWIDYDSLQHDLKLVGFTDFVRTGGKRHFDVLATRSDSHTN